MDTANMNYTILCPPQDDSMLSKAASWIGIITFISTTMGGFTILYTVYQAFEFAQEELLAYADAIVNYRTELSNDINTMETTFAQFPESETLFRDVHGIIYSYQEKAQDVQKDITNIRSHRKGLRRNVAIYRAGKNQSLKQSMRELERISNSLERFKVNLILRRLHAQEMMLLEKPLQLQENNLEEPTTSET